MNDIIIELENKIKDAETRLTDEWRNDEPNWNFCASLSGYIKGLREALALVKGNEDDQCQSI